MLASAGLGGKLGTTGARQVRDHPWFHKPVGIEPPVSWARLEGKDAKPPYVPMITSPHDVQNFDTYDVDEGPIEYPLEDQTGGHYSLTATRLLPIDTDAAWPLPLLAVASPRRYSTGVD